MQAKSRLAGQLAVFFVAFVAVRLLLAWVGIGEIEGWADPVANGVVAAVVWLAVIRAWNRVPGTGGERRGRRRDG